MNGETGFLQADEWTSIGNRRTNKIDDGIGAVETMFPGFRVQAIPLDSRDG
jgi:hypothetical protein